MKIGVAIAWSSGLADGGEVCVVAWGNRKAIDGDHRSVVEECECEAFSESLASSSGGVVGIFVQ